MIRPHLLGLLLLTGCSNFDQDYSQALREPPSAGHVTGAWEGRWESLVGHGSGPVRAIVGSIDNTPGIRFRSGFWGFFQIEQQVNLSSSDALAARGEEPRRISGQADLGLLAGGVYQYNGTITPQRFDLTYQSKWDHGELHLTRPTQ